MATLTACARKTSHGNSTLLGAQTLVQAEKVSGNSRLRRLALTYLLIELHIQLSESNRNLGLQVSNAFIQRLGRDMEQLESWDLACP